MNSEQYMNSKVKILGKRLYSPNLRDVAELESLQSRYNFSYICLQVGRKKLQTNVWKIKTPLKVFQNSCIPQILSIQSFSQYLNSAIHELLKIYFLKKLFAVKSPYKHSKFWADMSIYQECNAWRHLFAHRGLRNKTLWETK